MTKFKNKDRIELFRAVQKKEIVVVVMVKEGPHFGRENSRVIAVGDSFYLKLPDKVIWDLVGSDYRSVFEVEIRNYTKDVNMRW